MMAYWKSPSVDEDYLVFLEDDVSVSEYFMDWVLYSTAFLKNDIIGSSLYTPRINELVMNGKDHQEWKPRTLLASSPLKADYDSRQELIYPATGPKRLFKFGLPCSWGSLISARKWMDFVDYYNVRINVDIFPSIPDSLSNGWQHSWKKYLIEYMYLRNYYFIYPSFPDEHSFSTNFAEAGVHIPVSSSIEITKAIRYYTETKYTVPLLSDGNLLETLPRLCHDITLDTVNLFHHLI